MKKQLSNIVKFLFFLGIGVLLIWLAIRNKTAAELNRVLAYPKFRLTEQDRLELLGEYLPFCTIVECGAVCDIVCRDHGDQIFLNLASDGLADAVVTGDRDLLELSGKCRFVIETPALYQRRFAE